MYSIDAAAAAAAAAYIYTYIIYQAIINELYTHIMKECVCVCGEDC
jgi:hypothetical protein